MCVPEMNQSRPHPLVLNAGAYLLVLRGIEATTENTLNPQPHYKYEHTF